MILVDTSVWIDYFNGKKSEESDALDSALSDGIVAIGDIIFLKILQGFKNDKDYNRAKKTLVTLDQYELFGHVMVNSCADNYRLLRKKGITIRKTVDVIIATFCIENKIPLLFSDRGFEPFVKHLNLIPALKKA
ncbi:MAG: PIN domain nuclease [Proteobacteria bacterium]|nr:PIN domain nuclease [Pseudomonadota bacterium]